MDTSPLWNVGSCAAFLGKSPRWVWSALTNRPEDPGSMPHVRVGASPRFIPADIEEWVRQGCPSAAAFNAWCQRKTDVPVPQQSMDALISWRNENPNAKPTDILIPVRKNLFLTLNSDLEAADIPRKDIRGRVVDVHALRHTCGTWLNNAGVDPKSIQTIMRHKDIKTTYGTYIHAETKRLHAAVSAIPSLGAPTPETRAQNAQERPESASQNAADGVEFRESTLQK